MKSYYRVTITGNEAAAPRDGFIDNTTIEQYLAQGQTVASLANALAKERANLRYRKLVERLQILGNVILTNIKVDDDDGGPGSFTSADANTAAPEFSFTLVVEHGDDTLIAEDATEPGFTLTGTDAIRNQIELALTDLFTEKGYVIDPTIEAGLTRSVRAGFVAQDIEVGQVHTTYVAARATITINKITTL